MNLIILESSMKGLEHFDLALEKRSVDEYVYHLRRNGHIVESHVENTASIQDIEDSINLMYNTLMHKYMGNFVTVIGDSCRHLYIKGELCWRLSSSIRNTGVYYMYACLDDDYPLSCCLTIGRLPLMRFDNVHFDDVSSDMNFFIDQYLERALEPKTGCSNEWRIV